MTGIDARAFAERLRATAEHAERSKFTVANLGVLKIDEARALADILDASPAPAQEPAASVPVKVKALEWSPVEHERNNEDPTTEVVGYEANIGFWCNYSIEITGGGATLLDPGYWETEHASPEAAKAAAQADYERRILSALDTTPTQHEQAEAFRAGAEAMREAAIIEAEARCALTAADAIRAIALPTPPAGE